MVSATEGARPGSQAAAGWRRPRPGPRARGGEEGHHAGGAHPLRKPRRLRTASMRRLNAGSCSRGGWHCLSRQNGSSAFPCYLGAIIASSRRPATAWQRFIKRGMTNDEITGWPGKTPPPTRRAVDRSPTAPKDMSPTEGLNPIRTSSDCYARLYRIAPAGWALPVALLQADMPVGAGLHLMFGGEAVHVQRHRHLQQAVEVDQGWPSGTSPKLLT